MELGLVILAVFGASVAGVCGVTTQTEVTGMIGDPAVLTCSDTVNIDQLVLVKWERKGDIESANEVLVNVLRNWDDNTFKPPKWTNADLSKTVTTSLDNTGLSVNLEIKKLACQDVSEYVCVVQTLVETRRGSTSLKVEAKPEKPRIHYQTLVVTPGNPFSLECHGNVGRPPAELKWLMKPPNQLGFSLVEKQPHQTVTAANDCTYKATKTLEIVMTTKESSGTIYRCEVGSGNNHPEDPGFYDEVTVMLPPEPEPPQPTYEVTCEGGDCAQAIQDPNKAAMVPHGSVISIILSCILALLANVL